MSLPKLSQTEQDSLILRFRDDFKLSADAENNQRIREEEDLRFQVPEKQWLQDDIDARSGSTEGNVIIFPRPRLSISKIDQPIRLVETRFRQARFGVNVHPVSEKASQDCASFLQDLYRRIERDSNANEPRGFALGRSLRAGRGFYRIVVRPDEDGYEYGDLEIGIERILYQSCVYLDPAAKMPDWSDGEYAYLTDWSRLSDAERKYPGSMVAKAAKGDGLVWDNLKNQAPNWVRQNSTGIKFVQLAERFWKEHTEELLLILDNGRVIRDGVDKIPANRQVLAERVRDDVKVKHAITDGFDILHGPMDWLGKHIPIVTMLGRELHPFDEERWIVGMTYMARDAQRFFNSAISTLVERMFLEPRAPWVMAEGQDEGREEMWARANYSNVPVLKFKPQILESPSGTPVMAPPPFRTPVEQTGMSVALIGVQEASAMVQDATGYYDPSLGKRSRQEESGRKVMALQSQDDAVNDDWLDKVALAMRYEALCILDLIAPADKNRIGVYDAPGRITTVLGGPGEGKPKKVMVNVPFVTDPNTGIPRKARSDDQSKTHYDLRNGSRYGVAIEIGTGFKTRLQEADEVTTRIVEASPEMLGLIGDVLFRAKDFPFAPQIADRMEAWIRSQHPELFKDEEQGPEQIAARAKAAEGQVQQLSQLVQQLQQAQAVEQEKYASQERIKGMEFDFKSRLAQLEAATKITLERVKLAGGQAKEQEAETADTGRAVLEMGHESEENALQRDHERHMQHEKLAQETSMAVGGGNSVERSREHGQDTGTEQSRERSAGGSHENTSESGTQPRGEGE